MFSYQVVSIETNFCARATTVERSARGTAQSAPSTYLQNYLAFFENMSVLLEELEREGSVVLENYGHQVGGHHLLLKFKDTLCKPLITREHFFYQTAPEVIRRYIPTHHGVINVSYVHQPSGEIHVVASPQDKAVPLPLALSVNSQGRLPKVSTGSTIHSDVTSFTSKQVNGEKYMNPWAAMCSQNMDKILKDLGGELKTFTKDYMILENLTTKFQSPSVLDLKVGTRQHGDDAPPNKVMKHVYTCSISTSSSLGVRFCGMQKYDCSKNQYVFYDKYFGKQLTVEEFSQVLHSFLNNGLCFRSDLLSPLIKMLEDLMARIRSLPTFRYFSSSLLIIYDGVQTPEGLHHEEEELNDDKVDRILIRAKKAEESDQYLLSASAAKNNGLNTANSDLKTQATPTSSTTPLGPSSTPSPTPITMTTPLIPPFMSDEELAEVRSKVDMRMIDFGHATHAGYKDSILYEGPDDGYLVGLNSLVTIFKKMRRTCNENGRSS